MNDIAKLQNEPRQLQRLAAQCRLYSAAKRIFGFQLLLGGPVAIAWAFAVFAQLESRALLRYRDWWLALPIFCG